jgi:hypothetical protein
VERFNSKDLNDLEVKEQCQVKITNKFAVLGNMDDDDDAADDDDDEDVDINRASKSIRNNMKTSICSELKQHDPCFDEE